MNYRKIEIISLKEHPEINEKWVQQKIIEDPRILGLGDVTVKDAERIQPSAGRLDILLSDIAANRRYEVELQLGKSDESHIIRTIEYWDWERKRYPQYEHCAVIIAEDITSRFLNVISLFNGNIPLIAIQMKAIKFGNDEVGLIFSTVIDILTLGLDEEDTSEPTDRKYWEGRSSKDIVHMAEEILEFTTAFIGGYVLKYNKSYIGVAKDGISRNFISFYPQRSTIILNVKHPQNEEMDGLISKSDLEALAYDRQWNNYRFRISNSKDLERNKEALISIMNKAYQNYIS